MIEIKIKAPKGAFLLAIFRLTWNNVSEVFISLTCSYTKINVIRAFSYPEMYRKLRFVKIYRARAMVICELISLKEINFDEIPAVV